MPKRNDKDRKRPRKARAARASKKPPVVGIGASAGGIEALQAFFSAIPDDLGLAYVVIIHLAPDRESDLPEILARQTKMPVEQVGDHRMAKLAPNRVYVIAPNRKLEITDTSVGASQFEQPRGQRAAIDLFFRSLAASHGDGYAVVLSGSGSDGAIGAKAVKEAGGVVLVQDPREAGHDSMPRAAISTGTADLVLPVRELAARLAVLARNRRKLAGLLRAREQEPRIDEANERHFGGILELLRKRTGHDFSKYKRGTLLRRLARRMQLSHRTSVSGYFRYLRENVEEVQALFDDLLISVTTFFRDAPAWRALQEQVIGPLVEHADPDEPIRAWVAGCATGEEAYSLAILFQEEMERRNVERNFTIFASDVDEGALVTAREGAYPMAISADVSEARLQRHFRLQDHHYRVTSSLRDHVVFALHSLLRDPPFSRLNLISCRNLLIYLDPELQEQVMGLFLYACRPEAHLFLGVSETARDGMFRAVDEKHRIFQVRKSPEHDGRALPALLATPRGVLSREHQHKPSSRRPAAEIHLEALEAVAPPSLIVDDCWKILHLSNSAARYLHQRGGTIARQATDVVRPELRDEVHMVLHRAFEASEQQLSPFVAVRFNGTPRRVAVLARRHRQKQSGRSQVLLTFLEAGEASDEPSPKDEPNDELVRALREKLRQAETRSDGMRDDQHLANEDLRAANEELQSLNEEYRSTAEELETSKEELQSINEELQTVNHELKTKVEEISRAHDDLENLMAATNVATLFLDRDLRIKRFTPQLADLFNVTSRDRGRPIGNFTHRLDYDALQQDARAVLVDQNPLEREVRADDGRTFIARIGLYQTMSDQTEGVVMTLVDVSQLKRAESVLRESEEQFRALVDASAQMVWRTDAKGNVAGDSPSWRAFTGQGDAQWKADWLDAIHPDDREKARRDWRRAVETHSKYSAEFRVYHAPSREYRWTTVRAVPLRQPDGSIRGWVGMNVDVSERREAEEALRESDRRKDEFLAMLGHELRNPLAAIRSSVAVRNAAAAEEDPTSSRAWAVVDRQSGHMARLMNDLLDIVRIDRGKLRLQRAKVSLDECIGDVVEAVRSRIDAARLTLRLDLPDEPLFVDADPERLVQILGNLLRNSVSYTDAGGEIAILARAESGQAVVTIRDTGIGMEAGQIEVLFEPYRQAEDGGGGGGLGLGLTLVKRLVELHGGTVNAESDGIGTGSQFRITLPLARGAPATRATPLRTPARRRILVVDDETDVADMFGEVLESIGQEVDVAHSGEEALEAARRRAPNVAFLDLSMPVMGGNELARRLRRELAGDSLCLVALSGYAVDTRTSAEDFDRHLLKPVSLETVIEMLNSLPGG